MAARAAGLLAALVVGLAAVYCATDPLRLSAVANFPGFESHPVELPPWSELPAPRDAEDRLRRAEIRFLNQVQGPESIAFDPLGRGPYTGVADGRVLFWDGARWSDFAYTSPNRTEELCGPKPSPLSYLKNEHICGRPLGLRFDKKTGDLYIADAYFGLLKVGPQGGLATQLTTQAEGVPLNFTNDLDLDEEGNIYFTDSSTNYQRRNFLQLVFSGEPSGRLLKYSQITKETTVLLRGLQFPNGVSMSKDGSFFLFCEGSRGRLSRYWLKGEKAGTWEVFATLPGFPDNLRKFLLKLPIPVKYHYLMQIGGKLHGVIIKYGPEGELLEILEDRQGKVVRAVSEVEEKDGKLWIGSVLMPFIAVY
uniref:Strictosidine synthase conserved region domain-containing protein n=1 Tax=Ananas comosus var. bracteatus TaxID=296719 RepID=A0A6V7QYR2_ANACO